MRRPIDKEDVGGFRGERRTALKSVRYLGSARAGTEHFIRQRLTAASNAILVLVLAVVAIALSGKTYEEAVLLVGSPWVAVPLALAFISVCTHLKLGIQIIVEDYIHVDGVRILLLLLNAFFTIAIGALAIFAIVRIVFAAAMMPGDASL
jgi:succinate dehydrogenase / fumarate reductase membrane anchor subunit